MQKHLIMHYAIYTISTQSVIVIRRLYHTQHMILHVLSAFAARLTRSKGIRLIMSTANLRKSDWSATWVDLGGIMAKNR